MIEVYKLVTFQGTYTEVHRKGQKKFLISLIRTSMLRNVNFCMTNRTRTTKSKSIWSSLNIKKISKNQEIYILSFAQTTRHKYKYLNINTNIPRHKHKHNVDINTNIPRHKHIKPQHSHTQMHRTHPNILDIHTHF